MKDHALSPELIGLLAFGAVIAGMILSGFPWTSGRLATRTEGLDSILRAVDQDALVLMQRTRHWAWRRRTPNPKRTSGHILRSSLAPLPRFKHPH